MLRPYAGGFAVELPDVAPCGVTGAEIAFAFGSSVRHVELLARRGIAVRLGRGRYDLAKSTTNYVIHLRERAQERNEGVTASAKLKLVAAELAQARLDREAAELVSIADVRATWAEIVERLRRMIVDDFPASFSRAIPNIEPHDRALIERICRDGFDDCHLGRGAFDGAPLSFEADQ